MNSDSHDDLKPPKTKKMMEESSCLAVKVTTDENLATASKDVQMCVSGSTHCDQMMP